MDKGYEKHIDKRISEIRERRRLFKEKQKIKK